MSKSKLKHKITHEIAKVNQVIDRKIVRGLPYSREAHYHKLLLSRLSVIRKTGFLARSMRSFATMMF